MTDTATNTKTTVDEAFRILSQQVDKYNAHVLIAPMLLDRCHGLTLPDYHESPADDMSKLSVYRDMVKLILVHNGKLVERKPTAPASNTSIAALGNLSITSSERFTQLCGLIKSAGGDAHKKIAAHLRAVTGRSIALPVYNNDSSIPDADKTALYIECIEALREKDLSRLKGKTGAGDKKAESDNSAATPLNNGDNESNIANSDETVKPSTEMMMPTDTETDDPVALAERALAMAKAARAAQVKGPTIDRKVVTEMIEELFERRMAAINIPDDEEIKDLAGEAMNNGRFPKDKVMELITPALDTMGKAFEKRLAEFRPDVPIEEIRKAADSLLHGSVLEIIKKGGAVSVGKPTKTDEGDLASYVPKADPTYIVSSELKKMLGYVKDRSAKSPVNVMCVGPHGCGKTTLAEILAAEYKMPLLIMDCANIREKRDWFGYKYTDGGSVLWHRSQFDRCLTAGGHVIVLDELPRTTDEIRNTLFPLLDYRRRTFLEERGDYVEVGAGTIIFVTANEGMAYTGCSQLDLALDDRLGLRVEVTYLNEDDEANVLVKRTGIKLPDARKLAQIAKTIREKAIGLGATLTKTVSTRRLIEAAEAYTKLGVDGLTYALTNHFTAEGGTSSERAQVLLMVQGKFKA